MPLSRVKFAPIGIGATGNQSLIALVALKKIRVISLFLLTGVANNVYMTSNSGGTVIFGASAQPITLPAGGQINLSLNMQGWFETNVGEALFLNASSVGPLSGIIVYQEVAAG